MTKSVTAAVASIEEGAWQPIQYPSAIFDEAEQRWISDAEVAEVEFTAFTGRRKAEHVTCRLIVRRVKRLQPLASDGTEQGELFATYRHHAFITNSTLVMVEADQRHRDHAIVEQVIAELKDGPLAHLPSVILSRVVDHGADLDVRVGDGVLDAGFSGRWSARSDGFRDLLPGRVATAWLAEDPRCSLVAEGLGERVA